METQNLTALEFARRNGIPLENLEWMTEFTKMHEENCTYPGRVKLGFGEFLPKIDKGFILDAGCSYGATTLDLASLFPNCEIIGMDIEKRRLCMGLIGHNKSPRIRFQKGNFYRLNDYFELGTFSGIFVMNNLTQISTELGLLEHLLIAENFNVALKEGGYLCISDHGCSAVLRKDGVGWEKVHVEDGLRVINCFGCLMEAYGVETYPVGT